jgi:long-chain acyl-CoA synthetase
MRRQLATAWIALLLAGAAPAAEVAGVKLDDKVSLGGQELVLNGAGMRTKAFFKVYVAGLYLPQKQASTSAVLAQKPRRVQLALLRDLSSEQLLDALQSGLAANNTQAELDGMKKEQEQLAGIFGSLKEAKKGSVILLDFVDGATHVSVNGADNGSIPGEAFNRALLKVWLGDRPVQDDLKKAMLGT